MILLPMTNMPATKGRHARRRFSVPKDFDRAVTANPDSTAPTVPPALTTENILLASRVSRETKTRMPLCINRISTIVWIQTYSANTNHFWFSSRNALEKASENMKRKRKNRVSAVRLTLPTIDARAVDTAIQVHGGNGMSEEYGLVSLWGMARTLRIAPVSREMILNFIAQHVLKLPKSY